MKNNGVMNDKSGDDDTREARWQWKSDNQEETDQDVADKVSEDCLLYTSSEPTRPY